MNKLSDPQVKRGLLMKFQEMTMSGDNIEDQWNSIHKAISECTKEVVGLRSVLKIIGSRKTYILCIQRLMRRHKLILRGPYRQKIAKLKKN